MFDLKMSYDFQLQKERIKPKQQRKKKKKKLNSQVPKHQ